MDLPRQPTVVTDLEAAVSEFVDDADAVLSEYERGYVDADVALSRMERHVETLRERLEE